MSDNTDTPAWVPLLVAAIADALAVPADARCVSRERAAAALDISTRKLDSLTASGEGPASMLIDGRRVFPVAAIKRWIAERLQAG